MGEKRNQAHKRFARDWEHRTRTSNHCRTCIRSGDQASHRNVQVVREIQILVPFLSVRVAVVAVSVVLRVLYERSEEKEEEQRRIVATSTRGRVLRNYCIILFDG